MRLQDYRKKRKFDVTPEPRGRLAKGKGNLYLIQKHAARRLHYDFRLELDGVLKSWAVTRGPSLDPDDKRLAVHVEDHPLDYGGFEGTIPKGQYGGGTVMLWDRGRWYPAGDPRKGYAKGHLQFTLEGRKLKGTWHLVRMRKRQGEKQEPWLLIKGHDDEARAGKGAEILDDKPLSVATGRSMEQIATGRSRVWDSSKGIAAEVRRARQAAAKSKPAAAKAKEAKSKPARSAKRRKGGAPLPDFVEPALATLRAGAPRGTRWVHEIKFDGYRLQARLDGGKVQLLTRKGLDWTARFPNVAEAVADLPADTALVDGEVVVEVDGGATSFSALQEELKRKGSDRFVYYAFDLLHLDGTDWSRAPLTERKAALARLIADAGPVLQLSEHFTEDGPVIHRHACKLGLEGIVSKRADAAYRPGRSDAWLKIKCAAGQELVVAGYVPSTVMPRAIGALIAAYYDDGELRYAGRVGTGYSHKVAKELWKRLHVIETGKLPFASMPEPERTRRDAHWVKPTTVIDVAFRGWTGDGLLRQAAYKGLREDKPAGEVRRDTAAPDDAPMKSAAAARTRGKATVRRSSPAPKTESKPAARRPATAQVSVADVKLTHPDRVYWPDVGVTKQELAEYYVAVWDRMAPHVIGRPLSLLRCPEGVSGECFFQKHASSGLNDERLRTTNENGKTIITIDNLDGMIALVQAGVLEVHVRGSLTASTDRCDRIVFDLDPGDDVPWRDVVAAAREVRERLAMLKLESFVKLTGGKGLHVVLPVVPVDWRTAKDFANAVALAMAADEPNRYVAQVTKSLRKGRVYVDYLRNSHDATSVAVYSSRARPGAPVSAPVTWQELGRTRAGNQYDVRSLLKRIATQKSDPWSEVGHVKQKLPDFERKRR